MQRTLYELTTKGQEGNQEAIMAIIEKFSPLIKKYNRKLNYDGADIDLTIALIEVIKAIPISKNDNFKKEEQITGYISICLKNKYIQLSKKYGRISTMELPLYIEDIQDLNYSFEDHVFVDELLDKLTALQRDVINKKYIKNMSNVEIAKELHLRIQENRYLKQVEREKNYHKLVNDLTERFCILQAVKNNAVCQVVKSLLQFIYIYNAIKIFNLIGKVIAGR